jgi:lysophospholipase L1-like esterase
MTVQRGKTAALVAFLMLGLGLGGPGARAQTDATAPSPQIVWEVKSRFRLFRNETDFLRHVAADRGDGVLAAEERLARDSDGRGWAKDMVGSLCVDAGGQISETCERDGRQENYLAPADHHIAVVLTNAPTDATCAWSFDNGDDPPQVFNVACSEDVSLWVRYGRPTITTVDIALPDQTPQRVTTEILVHDLLVAGLGDSIASGEGNPDRPVLLANDGFCFRRLLDSGRGDYFRPGRAGYQGDKTCDMPAPNDAEWARHGALWMNAACHRSLYGYQLRTALTLAIESPHVAVTYIPLGCSGATITDGLLGSQRANETSCGAAGGGGPCSSRVSGQVTQLRDNLARAQRNQPDRHLDLLLLSIGANDIGFSGLVANVIMHAGIERALFERTGVIKTIDQAQAILSRDLPGRFAKLRAALKPLVGTLAHVVYVSYANPGLSGGEPCPGGPDGFDIHPAFAVDGGRLKEAAAFMAQTFAPALKALAQCTGSIICTDPASETMTFVDAHQSAFADHGFCVRSAQDPDFDRDCFSVIGQSFQTSLVAGATDPLLCEHEPQEFRAYAPRGRWIRTANDSYFSAMTYPDGLPATLQPSDIHDAVWGVLSAVYGGAIHPTAQGHAAIADAVLPAAREVLGLPAPAQ